MLTGLAFALAARGHEVEVITSAQRYDAPQERLPAHEVIEGVRVTRVRTSRFGRGSLPGRMVDYATFYVTALVALIRRARRRSIIVALTDPPLISVAAMIAARLRGARLINWIQDLFPEVAEGLGIRVPLARPLRDLSLRAARANVVLGERMAARVPRATVRHNWADAALHPVAKTANELRRSWNLGDALVAGYSGNLGRAHEFETILEASRLTPRIRFLIIGGGAQLESVQQRAPSNVEFRGYQPLARLSESLSAADVHLVSLQPALEGLIVPSKFYGILAVERPVIFIGALDGELARLIFESRCGFVVQPGDVAGLANVLRRLDDDRELARRMGLAGRALYEQRFAPPLAYATWEQIIAEAGE
jgi:colanic acid biosynthesis glycosyl transferase WcaI